MACKAGYDRNGRHMAGGSKPVMTSGKMGKKMTGKKAMGKK